MTTGQKLADIYRAASMKRFEELAGTHAGIDKMPPNYALLCHVAGAAAIDAALTPWWKKFFKRK